MSTRPAPAVDIGQLLDDGPISGLRKRVMALCALSTFLDGYDVQALGLAVPGMSKHFGVAPTSFAPALSGSLIGMAAGAILLSPLADRFGRRPMLIAMMLAIACSTIGVMFAASPLAIAAWRVVTGLALGATVPIAITLTTEYAPLKTRTALVTMMVACASLGSFAAGLVAPLAEARWGWRGVFIIGAVLPLAAAALQLFALPESLRFLQRKNPADPRIRRQLSSLGVPATTAIVLPPPEPLRSAPGVRALFSDGLRARTILLWTIFWLNLFANYSLISWLPTLLAGAGWARPAAQQATAFLAFGSIAGSLILAWLADRGKAVPSLIGAYALSALCLSLFVMAPGTGTLWYGVFALIGATAIGAQISLGSLSASYYPPAIRSTSLGWSGGVGRSGAIFGPLAVAYLMSAGWSDYGVIAFLMIPMLCCAMLILLLPRALRQRKPL